MADSWWQNPALWNTLINAIGTYIGINKSGQTPNFYQAPPTPGEQWNLDAKRNLYNYAGAYADQFLRGMGNMNPDFQLTSEGLGNKAFMGGVKVPVIDWSKMPARPGVTGGGATTTPGGGGAGTNVTDPDQKIPNPAIPGQDPFAGWPQNPDAKNYNMDDFKQFGPDAVKWALNYVGQGIPIGTVFSYFWNKYHSNNGLPPSNLDWSNIDFTPGSQFPNGPGGEPPKGEGPPKGGGEPPKGNEPPGRDVTVGGNLGDPGKPPPGWTLDNPYDWYNNYFGGGTSANDPFSGSPVGGRKYKP